MIKQPILAIAVALSFALAVPAMAAEHPSEHPKKDDQAKKEGDHPKEHPKKDAAGEVTTADISTGIKTILMRRAKKTGNFM